MTKTRKYNNRRNVKFKILTTFLFEFILFSHAIQSKTKHLLSVQFQIFLSISIEPFYTAVEMYAIKSILQRKKKSQTLFKRLLSFSYSEFFFVQCWTNLVSIHSYYKQVFSCKCEQPKMGLFKRKKLKENTMRIRKKIPNFNDFEQMKKMLRCGIKFYMSKTSAPEKCFFIILPHLFYRNLLSI